MQINDLLACTWCGRRDTSVQARYLWDPDLSCQECFDEEERLVAEAREQTAAALRRMAAREQRQ